MIKKHIIPPAKKLKPIIHRAERRKLNELLKKVAQGNNTSDLNFGRGIRWAKAHGRPPRPND